MAEYPVIEVDPRLQMSISLLAFCVPVSNRLLQHANLT